jgi:ABC-2 type transport system ATP-binding protein
MLEINDLCFGYSKKSSLFNSLNLDLTQGQICGLLGKNGSGKTTLLKIISGLIFPESGSCQVMGQIPQRRHPSFLREIFLLPEDLAVPALTTDDYVKFYSFFYPRFDHTLFQQCLSEFELPVNKLLTNFSYGQKKKFLIAFGIATNCRLFILDEPTNGLDIPSKAQFRKLLASAITSEKLFIISTHQVHDVENLIDLIVILDEGKIIFQQSLFEVIKNFAFVHSQVQPDPTECLFYEKHLSGYTAMIYNKNEQETNVNLEILFNAILATKNQNVKILSGKNV